MSPPKAVSCREPVKHLWPPPPPCLDAAVEPRSAASAVEPWMPNEPGGEARGRSALPALYMRLGKSVTCTSKALLSKERGLACLEAVGVWVIYSLSFSLEKHLLIERSWRGASDEETSQARSSPSVELPLARRVSHAAYACDVLLYFMKRRENVKFRMARLFPED